MSRIHVILTVLGRELEHSFSNQTPAEIFVLRKPRFDEIFDGVFTL